MGYEFQKQLAIKDALLADWELKNRALRESMSSSEELRGDLEERLAVQKGVYEAKLKKLTEERDISHRYRREVEEKWREEASEFEIFKEKNKNLISELNDRIATQDVVIGDLTDDLLRANRDNGRLEAKMEKVEKENRTYKRLEQELERFE